MNQRQKIKTNLPAPDDKAAQTESKMNKLVFSGVISLLKFFWWQLKQIGRYISFFI